MPLHTLSDPPTVSSLADARLVLEETRKSAIKLDAKIDTAELTLQQVVRESQSVIDELKRERAALEQKVTQTMAYLSPIRRLPTDLLRDVFVWCFEDHPCCAWLLAAVCPHWRRLALNMPKIWSKVRLVTSPHSSADTVRLWLERAGPTVPLDIEIHLRVGTSEISLPRKPRPSTLSPPPSPPPWALSFAHNTGVAAHYVVAHPPHLISPGGGSTFPPTEAPILLQQPSPVTPEPWPSSQRQAASSSTSSFHWGHIAIYYLVEQMHRWERFVFRFDKQFASVSALKSINGEAPLLKEFEVSGSETAFYPDWQWLANAPANATLVLPILRSLTLQLAPFKWSSPMLRSNLSVLNLRALPSAHLSLDRIMYIITQNPGLEELTLHFASVLPAVLPLTVATLPMLHTFRIGGHFMLNQVVEMLALPALRALTFDIEAREPFEDTIGGLLLRSKPGARLRNLSVAYGVSNNPTAFYYPTGGVVTSWAALLGDLVHLESLRVGGTPLEPLLTALVAPDEDGTEQGLHPNPAGWACPQLEILGMRNCHVHSEGLAKLVQVVEARNPTGPSMETGGSGLVRLKKLELYDCESLGQDVVQWLRSRIGEVVCTEAEYESIPVRYFG